MRRQLYRGGGITSIPRQGYGLGDIVKKVGKTVRKLIPNEIAELKSDMANAKSTVIQNNVDNSVKSAVSQGSSTRNFAITGPMHPLYGQAAN